MLAAYSADIRGRVIASVESGSSRREAAEEFDVSASSAIKWVAAYRTTGSCAAKPRGGSTSPLEKYATFLLMSSFFSSSSKSRRPAFSSSMGEPAIEPEPSRTSTQGSRWFVLSRRVTSGMLTSLMILPCSSACSKTRKIGHVGSAAPALGRLGEGSDGRGDPTMQKVLIYGAF